MAYFFRAYGLINLGLIVVLGFLATGGRAYCNFFCPVGALDALSNRIGTRFGNRMAISERKCNGCGICKEVCPTWAIEMKENKATIDQFSCFPCGICEKICPQAAVAMRRGKEAA
jgi:Pyruvate/2-oxoacid:ferredoxin oxidoreductase delta subunit